MKRSAAAIVTLAVGVLVALVPVGAASAHARPYCGITWGSLTKSAPERPGWRPQFDVRAGRHTCFDRLVIDGGAGWNHVEYVDQIRTDGAGFPVPVRGGARLEIVTVGADLLAHPCTERACTPYSDELVDVSGYRTFRQVAGAGNFEGHGTIGLGVRARLPFRVFSLADGRLVIDVAHRW